MLDLIGNEKIYRFLMEQELTLPLGKTWLFQGPRGVGKKEFAKQFALKNLTQHTMSSMSTTHPDMHLYRPLGKQAQYTVESMRHLKQQLYLPPSLAPFKIFILVDVENMPTQVSNFLLKTLEEPPKDTLFILTSDQSRLLPTITSRCHRFLFSKIEENQIVRYLQEQTQIEPNLAKKLAKKANGSISKAKRYLQDDTLLIHAHLIDLLEKKEGLDFELLRQMVQELEEKLINQVAKVEKSLMAQFNEQKERYNLQTQELELKQIEGQVSLYSKNLIEECFELILEFYRKHPNLIHVDTLLIKMTKKLHFNFKLSNLLEVLFLSLQSV